MGLRGKDCPEKSRHTKSPEGYLDFHDWAEKKSKTHRQIRCQGCGLYFIWVPKKKRKS